MSLRILPLVIVLSLIASLPASAFALGNRVWVNCRHGLTDPTSLSGCEAGFADARLVWDAEAAAEAFANGDPAPTGSVVTITTELDFNALTSGDYRLLVITQPGQCVVGVQSCCHSYESWPSPWCDTDLTMLIPHFRSLGGRVVLLADNDSAGEQAKNNALREILSSIPAHDLEIGNDSSGSACLQTNDILGDQLTEGLTGWKYAQANTVSGGTPLIRFNTGGSSQALAAVARFPNEGDVVVLGDVEGFWTASGICLDAGLHAPLWRNLYRDQSSAVDDDGDGYVDGKDCDDSDANINPGVPEDCSNGRDDDCDDAIDGADTDCGGSGDDDTGDDDTGDDDTGGSDDDDSWVSGGFDDNGGGQQWDTGCSCGAAGTGTGPSAWLTFALLGSAIATRRRRR